MTPLQQRGHDDTLAGRIDEVLANADSKEGREYRDGKRRAQWAREDAERNPASEAYAGICDGCGETKEGLATINCAPVAGASICPDCRLDGYNGPVPEVSPARYEPVPAHPKVMRNVPAGGCPNWPGCKAVVGCSSREGPECLGIGNVPPKTGAEEKKARKPKAADTAQLGLF